MSFDFEKYDPPELTERDLRAELERRQTRLLTALVALAAALADLVLAVLGVAIMRVSPLAGTACIAYLVTTTAGTGVIAFAAARRGSIK